MKVFISWSGDTSKALAAAIASWLPRMVPGVTPYFSPEDTTKGARWRAVIEKQLAQCKIGLSCMTMDNLHAPWIMFEAGALSKGATATKLCPVLFGANTSASDGPLSLFQCARFSKKEMKKAVTMINDALGNKKQTKSMLDQAYELRWPVLNEQVSKVMATAKRKGQLQSRKLRYDVFLSSPMAGHGRDKEYRRRRKEALELARCLSAHCGAKRISYAGFGIESKRDFEAPDTSAKDVLEAIRSSRIFVLMYRSSVVSSSLWEAGYALALNKPSVYFVKRKDDLPFLMQQAGQAFPGLVRIHECDKMDETIRLARIEGARLLGSP